MFTLSLDGMLTYMVWGQTDKGMVFPSHDTSNGEPGNLKAIAEKYDVLWVENTDILDSILIYDSHINGGYISQTHYVVEFHKRLIQVKEKVFDNTNFNHFLDDYNRDQVNNESDYGLVLFSNDKTGIKELFNTYVELKASGIFYISQLRERTKEAENLLAFIKKEYDLENE